MRWPALLLTLPLLVSAHPLEGRVWDTHAAVFITAEAAFDQAAVSRYLLLGEVHDSAIHHTLQQQMLEALARRGRKPALAMEQFDSERQAALSAAQADGARDPERLADAGSLNRKGWRWPFYRDLIAFAAAQGWPLRAANLSRGAARDVVLGKAIPALPAATPVQFAALERDIVEGHCGQRPDDAMLVGLMTAQRVRDAHMASIMESSPGDGAVLIAGAGHIRRDRAVPSHLKDGDGNVLTIAYVEVAEGRDAPRDYDGADYDLIWFTPPTARPDPCATPLTGTVTPVSRGR